MGFVFHNHIVYATSKEDATLFEFQKRLHTLYNSVLVIKVHPPFINTMFKNFGVDVLREIKMAGFLAMVDAKIADTPFTAKESVEMYENDGADIITVKASDGRHVLEEAVHAAKHARIFGVTLLSSSDEEATMRVYRTDVKHALIRLAQIVEDAECHGSVSAPRDLIWMQQAGIDLSARVRMCPNIRSENSAIPGDDQNKDRGLPPSEAAALGADLIVVGRPIRSAEDPREMANRIEEEFRKGKASEHSGIQH